MNRNFMLASIIYTCICPIAVAQDTLFVERLDSIVQMGEYDGEKTIFHYTKEVPNIEINTLHFSDGIWTLAKKEERSLDEKGRTTHSDIETYMDHVSTERICIHHIYNSQGFNTETTWNQQYMENGYCKRVFDEKGHLLQSLNYNVSGSIPLPLWETTTEYDSHGNATSRMEKVWKEGEKAIHSKHQWEYDRKGRQKLMQVFKYREGKPIWKGNIEYKYDKKGFLVEAVYIDDSEIDMKRKTLFFYDSLGNLLMEKHEVLRKNVVEDLSTEEYLYDTTMPSTRIQGNSYIVPYDKIYGEDTLPPHKYKLLEKRIIGNNGKTSVISYHYSGIKKTN